MIGVKKSRVCTRAVSGSSLKTPASSEVSMPTRRSGWLFRGRLFITLSRNPGPIFAAQPDARTFSVKYVFFSFSISATVVSLPVPRSFLFHLQIRILYNDCQKQGRPYTHEDIYHHLSIQSRSRDKLQTRRP